MNIYAANARPGSLEPPRFRAEGFYADGQAFQPQFFDTESDAMSWAGVVGATITRLCKTEDMSAEYLERQARGC